MRLLRLAARLVPPPRRLVAAMSSRPHPHPPPPPPPAKKVPHTHVYHGEQRADPYFWLRDSAAAEGQPKRQDVMDFIAGENAYTDAAVTRPAQHLADAVYAELVARTKEDDAEVPYRRGDYLYYKRTVKGLQYPLHCRKRADSDAQDSSEEEIFLDLNTLTEYEYKVLGCWRVSPSQQTLAYSLDTNGSEKYRIFVKSLATGSVTEVLESPLACDEIEWNGDDAFLYLTFDEIQRPFRVWRHKLGAPQSSDTLLYQEDDQKFIASIYKSNSDAYIFLQSKSSLTSEVRYLAAGDAASTQFTMIEPRKHNTLYSVEHQGGRFMILTNDGGRSMNFRLAMADIAAPCEQNWKQVIPYDPFVYLENMDAFKDYLVLYERSDALRRIRVLRANSSGQVDGTGETHYLEFAEPIYTLSGYPHQIYVSDTFRFSYTSLVTPRTLFEYNAKTKEKKLLKKTEVLGGYDESLYGMERLWAPIPAEHQVTLPHDTPVMDKVPISVVYKKSLFKRDGSNPAVFYGYGSYGISIDPYFRSDVISYLDRGFVYAIAHIRGGGDCGRAWYESGKFAHKANTFRDFITAGDEFVRQKYSSHELMTIIGRSAGGMLIGATVNMKPDFCKIAVAGVPFVDVLNTMMDPTIPLTVNEYEEWGNPNEPEIYAAMKSYSPYDNIKPGVRYPNLLIRAGINDPRVQYWEPSKWCAKLRDSSVYGSDGEHVVVLEMKTGHGHFGSSGRYEAFKDAAFEAGFVLQQTERAVAEYSATRN